MNTTSNKILLTASLLIVTGYILMSGPESSLTYSQSVALHSLTYSQSVALHSLTHSQSVALHSLTHSQSVALHSEQAFNPEIFSFRRIVIAPILCLTGYLLIIVGILKKQ